LIRGLAVDANFALIATSVHFLTDLLVGFSAISTS
jgi:hypothetical protein